MKRGLPLIVATIALAIPTVAQAHPSTSAHHKTVRALNAQVVKLQRQKKVLRARVVRLRSERNAARNERAQAQAVADTRGRLLTDATLRWIASNQTHGWSQDPLPVTELAARLRAGERLYITCGTVARLAVHILQSYGLEARTVHILSLDPPNGIDDGHIVMETRVPGGTWEVYDLDTNRKPVDAQGVGMTTATFVDVAPRQYNLLANDQAVDWTGHEENEATFGYVFESPEGLERWYDHILGVVSRYG